MAERNEGAGVQVGVKYAKLVKWENGPDGLPDKTKPPLEIQEKFSDVEPFRVTFRRNPDGTDQCGA